ncbi:hypothetical protein JCM6882_000352 [Rhodosporidiobolus microsporus]
MPPRRVSGRLSARAPSPDRVSFHSTDSAPASAPPTRRSTRASAAADPTAQSPSLNDGGSSRASTPESDNEPTTPPEETVDEGSNSPSGRPSRKRVPTTKALEQDQNMDDLRRTYERKKDFETTSAMEATSKKRQLTTQGAQPDPPSSDLTDYDEPEGEPQRKKRAPRAMEPVQSLAKAAPLSTVQDDKDYQPPQSKSTLATKSKKKNWRFDFQPTMAAPVKKPSAPTAGRSAGAKGKKGKRRERSPEVGTGKGDSFEVCLYGDAFAVLTAHLRSPRSSHQSTRPSRIALEPLSVLRSTNTSSNSFTSYRFPLPASNDSTSIERVVVKVAGDKVRGPRGTKKSVILEETPTGGFGGEKRARWVLVLRDGTARWVVR